MIVTVGASWRVASDGASWALQRRRGERWVAEAWYVALADALVAVLDKRLAEGAVEADVREAIAAIRSVYVELDRLARRLADEEAAA